MVVAVGLEDGAGAIDEMEAVAWKFLRLCELLRGLQSQATCLGNRAIRGCQRAPRGVSDMHRRLVRLREGAKGGSKQTNSLNGEAVQRCQSAHHT